MTDRPRLTWHTYRGAGRSDWHKLPAITEALPTQSGVAMWDPATAREVAQQEAARRATVQEAEASTVQPVGPTYRERLRNGLARLLRLG